MRDPKRIEPVIAELRRIWMTVPDWRFGQLMSNMFGDFCVKNNCHDIFFPEDDKWLEFLKEYMKEE